MAVFDHEVGESGFIDGTDVLFEFGDFVWIDIEADDIVACIGKADACDESYISGSNHGQLHIAYLLESSAWSIDFGSGGDMMRQVH